MTGFTHKIDIDELDNSIFAIRRFVKDIDVEPLIATLEQLKQEPENISLHTQLRDTLNAMGIAQGAMLTYAPYLIYLVSEGSFDSCSGD